MANNIMGKRTLVALLVCGSVVLPAQGYIDVTPTLGQLINDSVSIVVLRVEKVSLEKRAILFQKVADLKGESPSAPVRHQITAGFHPREPATVLEWAEPGQLAISFHDGKVAEICIGKYWYECYARADGWWTMTCGQAQLSFAYSGSVAKLQNAVATILTGKEAMVTAVKFGADDDYWSAAKRTIALRELPQGRQFTLCRFKASLRMPGYIYGMGRDSKFVITPGAAGPEEVPALVRALRDDNWRTRVDAAQILGSLSGAGDGVIHALEAALEDPKAEVRIEAAAALAALTPSPKEAARVLVELLTSSEAKIRKAAAQAIGNAGAEPTQCVPGLGSLLRDKEGAVRWAAAEALGRFGSGAATAAPALIEALADSDSTARAAATDALGALGRSAKAAIPALTKLLNEKDNALRAAVAGALYRIDRRAAEAAIPVLIEELKQSDTRLRWHGLHFLRKLAPAAKKQVPVDLLMESLNDVDFGVRGLAAWMLGEIGAPSGVAVPALVRALETDDHWVRNSSAAALFKILGPRATMAVPVLIEGLTDHNESTRENSLRALARIGSNAKEAIPALLEVARGDLKLRGASAMAVWQISGEPEASVRILVQALEDRDPDLQIEAVKYLGQMGPEARGAVLALRTLANKRNDSASAAAIATALRKIDGNASIDFALKERDDKVGLGWRLAAWGLTGLLIGLPILCWRRVACLAARGNSQGAEEGSFSVSH